MEARFRLHCIVGSVWLRWHQSHIVAARAWCLSWILTSAERLICGAAGRTIRSCTPRSVCIALMIASVDIHFVRRRCHICNLHGLQFFERVLLVGLRLSLDYGSIYFGELGSISALGQLLLAWISMFEKFLTLTLLAEDLELAMLIDLIILLIASILIESVRLRRWVTLGCIQVVRASWSKLICRLMKVGPWTEFMIGLNWLNLILLSLCLLMTRASRTLLGMA